MRGVILARILATLSNIKQLRERDYRYHVLALLFRAVATLAYTILPTYKFETKIGVKTQATSFVPQL